MNELFFIVHKNAGTCESANNKISSSDLRIRVYTSIIRRSIFFVNYVYFYRQSTSSRFVSDKHIAVFQPMYVKRELGIFMRLGNDVNRKHRLATFDLAVNTEKKTHI